MSPMNNRLLVPRKTPGLLDLVPGAAAAYSLRSLSNSYAGPVVTVRRSSDDSEEGFTAAEVADGTLAAFCGAGNGFVKQWWDQSGNANHCTSSADGVEPKVVDSGVLIAPGGVSAIRFDGVDDRMTFSTSSYSQPVTIISVVTGAIGGSQYYYDGIDVGGRHAILSDSSANRYVFCNTGVTVAIQTATGIHVDFAVFDGSASYVSTNGVSALASLGSTSFSGLKVSARYTNTNFSSLDWHTLIVYPSDQTANRELLEGQIAWSHSQ